jgi:SAM-dependent methyltransferase
MKNKIDFSYFEPSEALKIRIEAHKKFSKFSLEEYLQSNFKYENKNILDIGCGNGNFTEILSKNAQLYIGVEKNSQSIKEAFESSEGKKNVLFVSQDMDDPVLFPSDFFDYIFFVFSVYYTNAPEDLFKQCLRMLNKNGKLVMIGPTVNNAKEVDDFCFDMFSKERPSLVRARRIESEFVPILQNLGFGVEVSKINFNLEFPDYESYLNYLKSTLQYRDSFTGTFDAEKSKHLIEKVFNNILTKEVIAVCAEKK